MITNETNDDEAAPDAFLDVPTQRLEACLRCGTGHTSRELVFTDGFDGFRQHVCPTPADDIKEDRSCAL
jgi:hypothetical protein